MFWPGHCHFLALRARGPFRAILGAVSAKVAGSRNKTRVIQRARWADTFDLLGTSARGLQWKLSAESFQFDRDQHALGSRKREEDVKEFSSSNVSSFNVLLI